MAEDVEEVPEEGRSPSPTPTTKRARKPSRKAYVSVCFFCPSYSMCCGQPYRLEAMMEESQDESPPPRARITKKSFVFCLMYLTLRTLTA